MCDTWQSVYRALCPRYSTLTLAALVLEIEDAEQYREGGQRLIHGHTTLPLPGVWATPPPPCQGACLIGWLEWQEERNWGKELITVSDVEGWFADALATLEPGAWPRLGNWWDDPRNTEAARMVAAETRLIIEERLESAA